MSENAETTPQIYICYRRADQSAAARLVYENLSKTFGSANVFFDALIPIGVDFHSHMVQRACACKTLIVIVGPNFVGRLPKMQTQLMQKDDYVAEEIGIAQLLDAQIIPILVGSAKMPKPHELPEHIRGFSYLQATSLDLGRDFDWHMTTLIKAISQLQSNKSVAAI
jgi:hypothetical protein